MNSDDIAFFASKSIVQFTTNNIGSGALVTALLQSSSAVSLMVLAFVGAGVMNMQKADPTMMNNENETALEILCYPFCI